MAFGLAHSLRRCHGLSISRRPLCTSSLRPSACMRPPNGSRLQSTVVATASADLTPPHTPPPPLPRAPRLRVKPESIVAEELEHLRSQISLLLSSGYPGLDRTSKYYLQSAGKLVRPMVVFLMSRATSLAPKRAEWETATAALEARFNTPIAPRSILVDTNPDLAALSSKTMPATIPGAPGEPVQVFGSQRRLAEIVELIHTASLLHDDVIDHASTRRGHASANVFSGNKLSILAGDYMLGRASVYLARLRHPEVTELMAEVIAELVKGELFQLRNTAADPCSLDYLRKSLDYYLEKTYLKSASLIAKSCRATALLGGATEDVAAAAYRYGRHLGLAFQLTDDVLDYTGSDESIGKPAGADLELGLATAPVFFAWEEFPELGDMIARQFSEPDDAVRARQLVHRSSGIQRTRKLAQSYCNTARDALSLFPPSEARDALETVLENVLVRKK